MGDLDVKNPSLINLFISLDSTTTSYFKITNKKSELYYKNYQNKKYIQVKLLNENIFLKYNSTPELKQLYYFSHYTGDLNLMNKAIIEIFNRNQVYTLEFKGVY